MRAWGVIIAWWMCACSDEERGPAEADAASALESTFDSDTIALSGEVYSFEGDESSERLPEAARVCQDEPRHCSDILPDGRWLLDGLPPEREVLLTFEAPGYVTVLRPLVTPAFSSEIGEIGMIPFELNAALGEGINGLRVEAGLPELESKTFEGGLSFGATFDSGSNLDRTIHVRIEPEANNSEPVYSTSGDPGWSLAIPEGETAGFAAILNLPPREDYALVYTMDDGECSYFPSLLTAWPAHDGRTNVNRVPVRAGAHTYFTTLRCIPNGARPPLEGDL